MKNKITKLTAIILVMIAVFSMICIVPVSAVDNVVSITFDYCYDTAGNTIKFQKTTTDDGYTVGVAGEPLCRIYADGKDAFCIEPGHSLHVGDTLSKSAISAWKDLGSAKQKAVNLALLYGLPGSGSELNGTEDQKWVATQLIVWEFVSGCRSTKNGFTCTNTKFIDGITSGGANPGVKSVYNAISNRLANHSTVPSFASTIKSKSEIYEMKYSDGKYKLTLTDENKVLEKFNFKSTGGVTVTTSGNKLTVTTDSPLTKNVVFNCQKTMPDVGNSVLVPYGDSADQDVITGVENEDDPVRAYFRVQTDAGKLKLIKTSEDDVVENIKFTITGDEYEKTVKTNSKGEIEVENLEPGKYTITETVANRYQEQESKTVTVKSGKTTEVTFNNVLKKSSIKIIKKDAETNKIIPLAGFGFKIEDANGEFVKVEKETVFYTDETGTISLPVELSFGKYKLIEVQAGTGYVLDETPVEFTVNGKDTVVEVVKGNKPQKGTITITKTGEIFASVIADEITYQPVYETGTLSYAEFTILAKEDVVTPDGAVRYKKGETVDIITTDENGKAVSKPLYLGEYVVVESNIVDSYIHNEETYPVTLEYAGQNVDITNADLTVNNIRQKAEITLHKILEADERIGNNGEILNVAFALYANEEIKASDGTVIPKDGLIEIANCDEKGRVTFTTDISFGKYYVQEYATDEHYILDDSKYEFEFVYSDPEKAVQQILINDDKPIENKLIKGKLVISKKDVSTGKLIPDAGFRIKDEKGNIVIEGYTNEKGIAEFVLTYGRYIYEEFDAPDGYILDNTPYEFEIKENGQVIKAEMTNEKQPEPKQPQTGDSSHTGFYIGLIAIALGGLVSFVVVKLRKKDEEDSE